MWGRLLLAVLAALALGATGARGAEPLPAIGSSSAAFLRLPEGKLLVPGLGPSVRRLQPDASPDRSFGDDGTATLDPPLSGDVATTAIAVDDQGRIVLAASDGNDAVDSAGRHSYLIVARFLVDGSPDLGFGAAGRALVDLGPGSIDAASGVAIAADGRIVVGGQTCCGGIGDTLVAARLDPGGSLDPSFGGDGIATVSLESFGSTQPGPVAVEPDGDVLLSGTVKLPDSVDAALAVARLDAGGNLDRSFGGGLLTLDPHAAEWGIGTAVSLFAANGGVFVGGTERTGEHCCHNVVLAKVGPGGEVDRGYGNTGAGVLRLRQGGMTSATPLSDGGVLIGGKGAFGAFVTHLDPGGRPPARFERGVDSSVQVAGSFTQARAAFPEPDGGAIVFADLPGGRCAAATPHGRPCPAQGLIRFDAEDDLDRSFNGVGFLASPPIHYCPAMPFLTCGMDLTEAELRRLDARHRPRGARLQGRALTLRLHCDRRIETRCRLRTEVGVGQRRNRFLAKSASLGAGRSRLLRIPLPRRLPAATAAQRRLPIRQELVANAISASTHGVLRLAAGR
jgi:uncharacterized delta-60 repeat protein